jgi:hypothetical protein
MNKNAEKACEEVDAMVFSSDALHSEEAIKQFQDYLDRWQREAVKIREMLKDNK